MRELTRVVETYKIYVEEEVKELIEEAKESSEFNLTKYTSQYKEKKQKGEVIETYYVVSLTKDFNKESAF